MNWRLRNAVELAELWEANVTIAEDAASFIACFDTNKEAKLYARRANQSTGLIAFIDQRISRCVRVSLAPS